MADRRWEIVPATPALARAVADNLRADDRAEIEATGITPVRAVWRSYRASFVCRAVLVDGEPAAVFGLGGPLLSDTGTPWLLTTPAIERIPVSFVRQGRAELAAMLRVRPVLRNWVSANYGRACRFLEVLGFTLGAPEPVGPHGLPFRRFEISRDTAWAR